MLKNIILIFISSLVLTQKIHSENYILEIPTEIISQSTESTHYGLTDTDDVLVRCGAPLHKYAIWSRNAPLLFPEYADFKKIKSCGAAIGRTSDGKPVIWTKAKGTQVLELDKYFPNKMLNSTIGIIDINSSGQAIGSYRTKDGKMQSYIYQHNKAIDFNIEDELYALGYQVIEVKLTQINDRGSIAGNFQYGYKHPLKNTWVQEGTMHFFWNGEINILELSNSQPLIVSINSTLLNNNDEILINVYEINPSYAEYFLDTKSYLWTKENLVSPIPEGYTLDQPFSPSLQFNDHGQMILNELSTGKYFLYKGSHFIDISEILNEHNIKNLQPHSLTINNNGTICGQASIWGENHVFILRPNKS